MAAADAARLSVQKWRDGYTKGGAKGGKNWGDSLAAVKVCEGFEGGGVEPTVEEMAAAAKAKKSVQKWRDTLGKRGLGRKTGGAKSTEAVEARCTGAVLAEFNARKKAGADGTKGIRVTPAGTYRVKFNDSGCSFCIGTYDTEEKAARVYTIACMTRSINNAAATRNNVDPLTTEEEEIATMRTFIAHTVAKLKAKNNAKEAKPKPKPKPKPK